MYATNTRIPNVYYYIHLAFHYYLLINSQSEITHWLKQPA